MGLTEGNQVGATTLSAKREERVVMYVRLSHDNPERVKATMNRAIALDEVTSSKPRGYRVRTLCLFEAGCDEILGLAVLYR